MQPLVSSYPGQSTLSVCSSGSPWVQLRLSKYSVCSEVDGRFKQPIVHAVHAVHIEDNVTEHTCGCVQRGRLTCLRHWITQYVVCHHHSIATFLYR